MNSARDLLTRWPALDVAGKRARLNSAFRITPGPIARQLADHARSAEAAAGGLWRRDPAVWTEDTDVRQKIANRLGWLSSPLLMAESIDRILAFAASVRDAGFTDVVLLGMGGSSLAPEVLRAVLGVAPGWPRLHMLDSTDPAAVRAAATPPHKTLYLLSSKSGTTIEPNSLAAHFRSRLEDAGIAAWADHFVAITDEGTALASRARREHFRDVFINPADIGGRYSALSFFGVVPAALMGQNIGALVGWGLAMLSLCEPGVGSVDDNPAAALGLALAAAAHSGRDKLTLISPAALVPFGLWIEQLVAESTGKGGTGLIPISGEPLGEPPVYGNDRMFVRVRLHGSADEDMRDPEVRRLTDGGAPLAEIDLLEPSALGAEFVRWEVATAIAGALLHINPFDEPNVQQAKDATRVLLDGFKADGHLPVRTADLVVDGETAFTLSTAARQQLGFRSPDAFLTLLSAGDYFATLAYLGPANDLAVELDTLRQAVRDRARVATMSGYGPRYLHSTGQLHKGGPNSGVFLLITAAPAVDIPIPGEDYTFGTLELAQAIGDFNSLEATGRRALHVHAPAPDRFLIRRVVQTLLARLPAAH